MPYPPLWNTLRPEFERIGTASGKVSPAWQNLTYTYIFDYFCHCLVGTDRFAEMRKSGNYPSLEFDQQKSQKRGSYFFDFFNNYFPPQPDDKRIAQFNFAAQLKTSIDVYQQKEDEIRNFFQRLHAVTSSINHVPAMNSINNADINRLKDLLFIIRDNSRSYDLRFQQALTNARIPNIGESCVGEIFGWLMPNDYPIYNEKFSKTLLYLGNSR